MSINYFPCHSIIKHPFGSCWRDWRTKTTTYQWLSLKENFQFLVFCWDWSHVGRVGLQLALQLRNTLDWCSSFYHVSIGLHTRTIAPSFVRSGHGPQGLVRVRHLAYLATSPSREEFPKQVKPEHGQGPCRPNTVCMLQIMLETLAGWVLQAPWDATWGFPSIKWLSYFKLLISLWAFLIHAALVY